MIYKAFPCGYLFLNGTYQQILESYHQQKMALACFLLISNVGVFTHNYLISRHLIFYDYFGKMASNMLYLRCKRLTSVNQGREWRWQSGSTNISTDGNYTWTTAMGGNMKPLIPHGVKRGKNVGYIVKIALILLNSRMGVKVTRNTPYRVVNRQGGKDDETDNDSDFSARLQYVTRSVSHELLGRNIWHVLSPADGWRERYRTGTQ